MLVSESNIFNSPTIKLRITNMDGKDIEIEVPTETTIDRVKVIVVANLYDRSDSAKTSLYHRLIHAGQGRPLNEEQTVLAEGLKDNDELLLVKKRLPPQPLSTAASKKDDKKAPSLDAIKKATEGLPARCIDKEPIKASVIDGSIAAAFQVELRKILVSLIDVAQKLLCLNPESAKLLQQNPDANQVIPSDTAVARPKTKPVKMDDSALNFLVDMGFRENRARKALHATRMNSEAAVQWLIEHESDPDIDDPLPPTPTHDDTEDSPQVDPAPSSAAVEVAKTSSSEGGAVPPEALSNMSPVEKVSMMLRQYRAMRRKDFNPNQRALKNLVEMGFDENDVIDALRVNSNKLDDACEWLVGGQNRKLADEKLPDPLPQGSPLFKAITANPVVQLGLNNHRSLLAFLAILENPNSTQMWLNDNDIGPMLLQISKIYHAEKNALNSTPSGAASS